MIKFDNDPDNNWRIVVDGDKIHIEADIKAAHVDNFVNAVRAALQMWLPVR